MCADPTQTACYPPLRPWAIATLVLGVLAAGVGWRPRWDPWAPDPGARLGTLERLQPRDPGQPGLLFLGDSRLGLALDGGLHEVLEPAGLGGAAGVVVWGPELRVEELRPALARLEAWAPELVVVQLELAFPLGPVASGARPGQRLLGFERAGPALLATLELLERLGADRAVAVDLPCSARQWEALDAAWHADRARSWAQLEAHGVPVLRERGPWPDSLYTDGAHLDPLGAARLRAWLGAALGAALAAGPAAEAP